MESWTICNFDPKVPLVKFIFKIRGGPRGYKQINNKMEILLPMEGVGGGGRGVGGGKKRTAVKQVSIVNLFDLTLKQLNYFFIDFWN